MTNKSSAEIWGEVVKVTGAQAVEATEEERETLARLEEASRKSERDGKLSREVRERKKREEALLAQARGEMDGGA